MSLSKKIAQIVYTEPEFVNVLRSPRIRFFGIDSARLGNNSRAPYKVYKYGLSILIHTGKGGGGGEREPTKAGTKYQHD
jgi:hypothetical protein